MLVEICSPYIPVVIAVVSEWHGSEYNRLVDMQVVGTNAISIDIPVDISGALTFDHSVMIKSTGS
eukprot:COSAG05_NODE_6119_length_1018_cov_161.738847_1_plen_65_part_00